MQRTTTNEETACYSYEVNMVIQVIANSKEEADSKLDQQGGHITYRDVQLKDSVSLFNKTEGSSDEA